MQLYSHIQRQVLQQYIYSIDIPTPPGFILTTHAYHDYINERATYESLEVVYKRALRSLEDSSGRKFQPEYLDIDEKFPMLLSLRASASPGCFNGYVSSLL
jgi:phosphoenolpyruvate synthase/pyruvate phosphate dikinase